MISESKKFNFKKTTLFACLSDHELDHLMKIMKKRVYPKNKVILNEGDLSDGIYIIVRGKVKAVVNHENGKEVILNIHGPGEYFGEIGLIDGGPRSATIITKESTVLMMIMRRDFKPVLASHPDIYLRLLKGLTERMRYATHNIENMAFLDVQGRVVKVLTRLARNVNQTFVVYERLTHQEIANMVGSSREMVSRVLKELEITGYISVDHKQITLQKQMPLLH